MFMWRYMGTHVVLMCVVMSVVAGKFQNNHLRQLETGKQVDMEHITLNVAAE